MSRTPDPIGESVELPEIGLDPVLVGEITLNSGAIKARDSIGTFNLRQPIVIVPVKGQTNGSTSDPTYTSAPFVVVPEMTVTIATQGGDVNVLFSGTFNLLNNDSFDVAIFSDGVEVTGTRRRLDYGSSQGALDPVANVTLEASIHALITGLSAASHTFDARWSVAGGTARARLTERKIIAMEQVIAGPPSAGLTETQHRSLDQLVHEVAESSFDQVVYTGNRVDAIITWTSSGMTTKIREELYTYTGNKITQIVTKQYNGAGVLITGETMTEVIAYTGSQVTDITRTMT